MEDKEIEDEIDRMIAKLDAEWVEEEVKHINVNELKVNIDHANKLNIDDDELPILESSDDDEEDSPDADTDSDSDDDEEVHLFDEELEE